MEKPEFTNSFFRDKFLEEVKKRSPGSYVNNNLVIRDLLKEIPKPLAAKYSPSQAFEKSPKRSGFSGFPKFRQSAKE